jgi:multidrug transporter EmrE-like cation transporter
VANGGALLLTVLISVAVFREKLSARRLAGFLLGLLSIVLLSLPV